MELYELLSLKTEYEHELAVAEAKVAVICDIIAKAEAKNQSVDETETTEAEQITADTNIY